jgi:hypothetical protein
MVIRATRRAGVVVSATLGLPSLHSATTAAILELRVNRPRRVVIPSRAASPESGSATSPARHGRRVPLALSRRWNQTVINFVAPGDGVDPKPSAEDAEFLREADHPFQRASREPRPCCWPALTVIARTNRVAPPEGQEIIFASCGCRLHLGVDATKSYKPSNGRRRWRQDFRYIALDILPIFPLQSEHRRYIYDMLFCCRDRV